MLAKLIFRELWHRKISFLLAMLAVAAAVAVCVALIMTEEANQRETRKVMLKMGFNLRIIPKIANINQFYLNGYSAETMPEEFLDKIASVSKISYNHLLGTLERKIELQGADALLLGISDEKAPPGRKKPPMVSTIEPATVHVGFQIARRLGLAKGDSLEILGESFQVARCMPQLGTLDDIRLMVALVDAQQLLKEPGRINEIKAMDCLCLTPDQDPRAQLQAELEKALPDGQVVMLSRIAEARARQRQVSEKHAVLITTVVGIAAAIWVAVLAVANVRQRIAEIGLLRALGYDSNSVALLVLGRALLVGLLASVAGFAAGTWWAIHYGRLSFQVTGKAIAADPVLFYWSLALAPLLAVIACLIPTALAVVQDPADALRRE